MKKQWVKKYLIIGAIVCSFLAGFLIGPELKSYYLHQILRQFETWKAEGALAEYTDDAQFAYQFLDGGRIYVGIYPRLTSKTRGILRTYFYDSDLVQYDRSDKVME